MQIIMPLILIVGIAQILAIQVLMPQNKDKSILMASIIGACLGVISNFLFVQKYGSVGSSIVLLVSELTVTTYYIYIVKKNKTIEFPWEQCLKHLTWSIPYILICILIKYLFENPVFILLYAGFFSILYFIIVNMIIIKNPAISKIFNSIYNR